MRQLPNINYFMLQLHDNFMKIPDIRGSAIEAKRETEAGAGEGNRTLVVSLEGFCSTIELHPHFLPDQYQTDRMRWWRGLDLNQRTLARADLQSAAIDRSATPPRGCLRVSRQARTLGAIRAGSGYL
jgi:hypothetical protein